MGVCVGRVIKVIPLHMIPCTQSGQAVPNVARPKKMSDGNTPLLIIWVKLPFGPTKWSCPKYSPKDFGRMRSAKGVFML